MYYQITNDQLTANIHELGAELVSVKDATGTEFIFQPSPLWPGQAKTLFPNVGLAKEDCAIIRGKKYPMYQHGFLKDQILSVVKQERDSITFLLESGEETRRFVPYEFRVYISFRLSSNQLIHSFHVENLEEETMYFGLASHTGFCTDTRSYVDFLGNDHLREVCRRDMKYVTGETVDFPLEEGKLPVSPKYYAVGARILEGLQDRRLKLYNPGLGTAVEISFRDFDRITLWSTPDARTVLCMMPWLALPDYENTDHVFETKPGNVELAGGACFEAAQTFTFSSAEGRLR